MKDIHNLQPSLGTLESTEKVQRLTDEQESNKSDKNIPLPLILKCSKCKSLKDSSEFYKSLKYTRGFEYRCKECARQRSVEYHEDNREILLFKWKSKRENLTQEQKKEIANKNRDWYRLDIRKRLLWRAKERSNKEGILCNLDLEDIIIPEVCPLLKVPFIYGGKYDKWFTYSIDRVDNSKGYIKGNIQVITYLANTMKSHASKQQLITFATNILKLLKEDDIV